MNKLATLALGRKVGGSGGEGGTGLYDVDVLPTENIDKNGVYRLREQLVEVYAKSGNEVVSAKVVLGSSFNLTYDVVDALPQENIKGFDQETMTVPVYVVSDSGMPYIYMEGSWLTVMEAVGIPLPFIGKITDIGEITDTGFYTLLVDKGVLYAWNSDAGKLAEFGYSYWITPNNNIQYAIVNGHDLVIVANGTIGPYSSSGEQPWWNMLQSIFIENVYISGGVTKFGQYAFSGFNISGTMHIPHGVTNIGSRALNGSIGKLSLPPTVTTIDRYAFGDVNSVYISDLSAWCKIKLYTWNTDLIEGPIFGAPEMHERELYLNNTLVTSAEIPSDVTALGNAFTRCTSITHIKIPSTVVSIAASAFQYCVNLAEIEIEEGVTTIGNSAFDKCPITSIVLPSSITSIGTEAFEGCKNLVSVTLPSNITVLGKLFPYCTSLKSIEIPASVTTFSDSTFENCTALTKVIMKSTTPPTIKQYDHSKPFYKCTALKEIIVPAGCGEAYKTTANWSTYANLIVEATE